MGGLRLRYNQRPMNRPFGLALGIALFFAPKLATAEDVTPTAPADVTAASVPATAETGPSAAVLAPSVTGPTQWLIARLDANRDYSALWWWGWTSVFTGSAVVQGGAYLVFTDPKWETFRAQRLVSGVSSAIGAASMFIPLYPAIQGADGLPEDSFERRVEAERRLRASAERERFGRGWMTYAGSVLVGGGGSAVLWFYYDYRTEAAINLTMSWTVGLIKILTQPTHSADDWETYQATFGAGGPGPAATDRKPRIALMPVVLPGGAGLSASF